ncbi:hypothetical protein IMZ48_36600 [Candidatus Bathyarchaeota archaeon]|nr:hypothetical protein [Candidatus Bathyarchaeota archaeon]
MGSSKGRATARLRALDRPRLSRSRRLPLLRWQHLIDPIILHRRRVVVIFVRLDNQSRLSHWWWTVVDPGGWVDIAEVLVRIFKNIEPHTWRVARATSHVLSNTLPWLFFR